MTGKRLLVVGALAAAAYYYTAGTSNSGSPEEQTGKDDDVSCPEGYLLSDDKQSCLELNPDGTVMDQETENPCPDGLVLSSDGKDCVCPEGQVYDGSKCAKDLNINTGSAIGDMAANMGISIGTSVIAQSLIDKALAPRGSGAAQAAAAAAEKRRAKR